MTEIFLVSEKLLFSFVDLFLFLHMVRYSLCVSLVAHLAEETKKAGMVQ